eukprot:3938771-Rhodomonas_salina.1
MRQSEKDPEALRWHLSTLDFRIRCKNVIHRYSAENGFEVRVRVHCLSVSPVWLALATSCAATS